MVFSYQVYQKNEVIVLQKNKILFEVIVPTLSIRKIARYIFDIENHNLLGI